MAYFLLGIALVHAASLLVYLMLLLNARRTLKSRHYVITERPLRTDSKVNHILFLYFASLLVLAAFSYFISTAYFVV